MVIDLYWTGKQLFEAVTGISTTSSMIYKKLVITYYDNLSTLNIQQGDVILICDIEKLEHEKVLCIKNISNTLIHAKILYIAYETGRTLSDSTACFGQCGCDTDETLRRLGKRAYS
jgi:hypothetical protein